MKKLSVVGVLAGMVVAGLLALSMFLSKDAIAEGPAKSGAPDVTLINGSWILASWSDPADLPDADISLNVETGEEGLRVYGISACNNYMGPITVEGASFSAGLMALTQMLCADSADAEMTYLELLAKADSWAMDGDCLVLSADDTEVLRFDRV